MAAADPIPASPMAALRLDENLMAPDQVIRRLIEGDKVLAQGKTIEEVARHLEISEQTFHRWRAHEGNETSIAIGSPTTASATSPVG